MSASYTRFLDPNETQTIVRAAEAAAARDNSTKLRPGETCATLSDPVDGYPGCQYARSCRSCLQKQGCMITQTGRCDINPGVYDDSYFRIAFGQNAVVLSPNQTLPTSLVQNGTYQVWIFPALDAPYCDTNDTVCRQCWENRFWLGGNYSDSRFCVGANGCVCVANCVDAEYPTTQGYLICTEYGGDGIGGSRQAIDDSHDRITLIFLTGIAVVGAVAVIRRAIRERRNRELFRANQRRLREARREQRLHEVSSQLGVGVLSLTSWKAYREGIIRSEERQLAGMDGPGSLASPTETSFEETTEQYLEPRRALVVEVSTGTPRNGLR